MTSNPWQLDSRALFLPVFFACVFLFSIFLHAKLGMDSFWDTANYHVFLGWSLLASSFGDFGAAAQYHSYLNPLIDGLNYLSFFSHPYIGAAFHSVNYVVFAYIVYRLARDLVHEDQKIPFFAILGCTIGITGAMTVSLFGSWTNENIVAVPVLLGLHVLLRGIKQDAPLLFLCAGISFGIAAGLKLTAAHYLVGAFFACVFSTFRLKLVFSFLIGVSVGFLLADGYFMYIRWTFTENPFFPFANNIFNSPYYSDDWKSFSKFDPSKILYYLSLPVVWLSSGDFSEASTVRDGRLLLAYLGIFLIMVNFLVLRKIDRQKLALMFFFIFSFFTWILVFRIYRYLIVLEALSGILWVGGLVGILNNISKYKQLSIALMALPFLWHITYYPDWGRRPWGESFSVSNVVDLISESKKTLVLFADQRVSYLAPELHRAGIEFANMYSQQWWDGERGKSMMDPDSSTDPKVFNLSDFQNIYFIQYSRFDPRSRSRYLNDAFPDQYYDCVKIKTNNIWNPYLCRFKEIDLLPRIRLNFEYTHLTNDIIFNDGWSDSEPTHRWTDGKKSSLLFKIDENITCSPYLKITGFTLGRQFIDILVNGDTVYGNWIEGRVSIERSFSVETIKNGLIRVEFIMPEARTPENGDPRVLALALQSIRIGCEE